MRDDVKLGPCKGQGLFQMMVWPIRDYSNVGPH